MNEFINTFDTMSPEEAEDAVVEGTLTQLSDIRFTSANIQGFSEMVSINMPLMTAPYVVGLKKLKEAKFLSANRITSEQCMAIEILHLPSHDRYLEYSPFYYCTALTTLILSNKHHVSAMQTTRTLQNTPIANGTGYVYVRKKLLEQYKSATNWSTFASQIRAIEDYPEIKAIVDADLAEMRGETV